MMVSSSTRLVVLSKRLEAGVNTKGPFSHPDLRFVVECIRRILWVILVFRDVFKPPPSLSCSNSMLFMFYIPTCTRMSCSLTSILDIPDQERPRIDWGGVYPFCGSASRGTAKRFRVVEGLCFSHHAMDNVADGVRILPDLVRGIPQRRHDLAGM